MPPSEEARWALVTGATGGLGRQISFGLARQGFRLLLHGRNGPALAALGAEIEREGVPPPEMLIARFDDLRSVASLCEAVEARADRLDVLVNNAGTGFAEANRTTSDGHRLTLQVNYLVPYLLMHRLLPLMEQSPASIILNIASAGQADLPEELALGAEPAAAVAYGQSKLALIMATQTLAEQRGDRPPKVLALHPGSMLDTGMTRALLRRMPRWVTTAWRATRPFRPTVEAAAAFVAALASDAGGEARASGTFWTATRRGRVRRQATDRQARSRLEAFSRAALADYLAHPRQTPRRRAGSWQRGSEVEVDRVGCDRAASTADFGCCSEVTASPREVVQRQKSASVAPHRPDASSAR